MSNECRSRNQGFLIFCFLKSLAESYLDARNKKCIAENANQVPEKFSQKITLEEHQKAASYSIEKIKVSNFFQFVNLGILLLWTIGGGLNALDQWVRTLGLSSNIAGLTFFASFGLISTLLGLPQAIYGTFVVEEKFGFNKTTPKLFVIDTFKGLLLGALIGLPIIYGILLIMEALGNYWWVYAWGFLTAIQFVLLWAYPRFIAPLFNKFYPMEEGETKDQVLDLLGRTGFTSNGLFVMNASIRSSHGNAYFTGFGKNKRIVFFDTLIKTLDASEVVAVLAHELGHFKRKHITKQLAKSIIFSLIGFWILGILVKSQVFFQGHGIDQASNYLAIVLFSMVSGIYTFFLTPLSSWVSRKYEYEADQFASENANYQSLISALVKLYKDNANTLTPDPVYSSFYHSHPPALERVQYLESINKG